MFEFQPAQPRHDVHATFMPKPLYGENGSGMHINQSLSRGGQNAFFDPSDELQLSATAYGYIAGLLEHLPALTAICNPTVNSYKRLIPGYEAPVYIAWSPGNRSAAIRIPAKRGHSTRAELRTPDPTANPYLAFACLLQAGLDGVKRGLRPPAPVNVNIYHLSDEESVSWASRAYRTTSRTRSRHSRPTRCSRPRSATTSSTPSSARSAANGPTTASRCTTGSSSSTSTATRSDLSALRRAAGLPSGSPARRVVNSSVT